MDAQTWSALSREVRAQLVDNSCLTAQLVGLEGWRVEVVDRDGNKRRFIVGKSMGWRPCHLEVLTRRSLGGDPADPRGYSSVRRIEQVR
jgi:hypothetical protein